MKAGNITLGKAKSVVIQQLIKPPNQQINGKEGKRKKINNSLWIGLPDKPSRLRIFDLYAHIKTKRLIHWRVYCTRIWKKPLETEGKAAMSDSPTITRKSPCVPEEGSDELFLRFALTFKARNAKTVQSCLIYRLGDEYSQQTRRYLCEKLQDSRNTQKKRNTRSSMRLPRKLLNNSSQHIQWLITVGLFY